MEEFAYYSQKVLALFVFFCGFRMLFRLLALFFKSNETPTGSGVPTDAEWLNNMFVGDRMKETRDRASRAILWMLFSLALLAGHQFLFRLDL